MPGHPPESLQQATESEYGPDYKGHLLEQYRIFVEMADKISDRRTLTNRYFFAINSIFIAALGVLTQLESALMFNLALFVITGIGIIFCYLWRTLIVEYMNLNTMKFAIIQEMESLLPLKPYTYEWFKLRFGKDSRKYLPFSHIEMRVPYMMIMFYIAVLLIGVFCSYR